MKKLLNTHYEVEPTEQSWKITLTITFDVDKAAPEQVVTQTAQRFAKSVQDCILGLMTGVKR